MRELFRARGGELCSEEFLSREFGSICINEQQQVKPEADQIQSTVDHMEEVKEAGSSNASDEFFDFPEPSESDDEHDWASETSQHCYLVLVIKLLKNIIFILFFIILFSFHLCRKIVSLNCHQLLDL